ncbi:MAG: putative DNA helicase [Satyrvirus sp.]|uniref:Putative DNA helicase n=1 Tax=Satyrvirus sp. TaxID=2487771 RepID=A0A3G5ADX9_9VIRU|nr:MAG: putative DNA helicase [Satyrvirus sp.]
MQIILNEKQKIAVEKINKFISQDKDKTFYLMGYPGSGKTFLISRIIKDLLETNKIGNIFICAPTHQALNVIESYIKSNSNSNLLSRINFMTIHKLLEFRPIIMANDGSKIFKSTKESKFLKQMEDQYIVIDECSMIQKDMVVQLQKYCDLYPIKIIYLGDREQLNPVNERESLVFNTIPKNYEFYVLLDQIMRTKSAEIMEVCKTIREWNKKDSLCNSLLPIHNKKIDNKTFKFYHKYKKLNANENISGFSGTSWFKNYIIKLETGNIPIILTWKNSTADMYNQIIRQHIHKTTNLHNYMVGDCAMFSNYYTSPDGSSFYTSDMVKILDIKTDEKILFDWMQLKLENPSNRISLGFNTILKKISCQKNKFNINVFSVQRVYSDIISSVTNDKTYIIQTICLDNLADYNAMLKNVQKHIEFFFKNYKDENTASKLWAVYHKSLVDPYAIINFGYSETTRKAQGSTLDSVFVDVQDIGENPDTDEMEKYLYTAAGRASKELGFLL